MDSMLNRRTISYNFRNLQEFQSERKRTVFYGLETISYRAPQLWTIFPEVFKQRNTISLFKSDVRQWIYTECPCRLCKVFVPNLGFTWGTAPNLVLNIYHLIFNACTYIHESWAGRNTCMWICTLWICSLSTLENTDENKIFFFVHHKHFG